MKFLPKYLSDIRRECEKYGIPLIIADDNSTDGSLGYLLENGYNVSINRRTRSGFAANVNNGIVYSKSISNFDYYIISNNDVLFKRNFLKYFLTSLQYLSRLNSNIGLIGIQEINLSKKNHFYSYEIENFSVENFRFVDEIPGFFMTITKDLINNIGLFDEDYFMYGEDNDYFYRTRKSGFELIQIDLPALHLSEGSSSNQKKTSWYVYRNAFLYAQKNLGVFEFMKLFASFINQIYNPFLKNDSPSSIRIRRNGFLYNNFLLLKSFVWNFKFYLDKKFLRRNG